MAIIFPSGTLSAPTKVLQIQETRLTGTYSFVSNNSWTTLTGFSRSITTLGASSKILVVVSMGIVKPQGNTVGFKFIRNGSDFAVASANSSRARMLFRHTDQSTDTSHANAVSFSVLDSPGASAGTSLNYQLQGYHEGSGTTYVNRNWTYSNTNSAEQGVTVSTIQVMEIAA